MPPPHYIMDLKAGSRPNISSMKAWLHQTLATSFLSSSLPIEINYVFYNGIPSHFQYIFYNWDAFLCDMFSQNKNIFFHLKFNSVFYNGSRKPDARSHGTSGS